MSVPRQPLHLSAGSTLAGILLLLAATASSAEFKLEHAVSGTAAGEASGGVYRVADTGGQSTVGTSESGPWRIDHGFWHTMGTPPVPATLHRSILSGQTLELSLATIIAQVDDPDGDAVQIVSVAPDSARGGTVNHGATAVTYTPPSGFAGLDHFTYHVADAGGDVASGAITVTVGAAPPEPPHVVYGPITTNGVLLVRYGGAPGLTYTIEARERLDAGAWQKLFNVTAPGDGAGAGVFEVRDVVANESSRFYRVVWPAY